MNFSLANILAAVVELADTSDLKSDANQVAYRFESGQRHHDLYVFQFLLNGLNRNDRFGSFKCTNYLRIFWRPAIWVLAINQFFNNIDRIMARYLIVRFDSSKVD